MREKELEKLKDYKYGFSTDIENIKAPKGLNEDVIKFISNIKKEPEWMLNFRLKAFERFKQLKEPNWQKPKYPKIDYQNLYYYSAPKSMKDKPKSLDELDPKLLETYKKLGIPLQEQARLNGIAVDAVFDSVSVATTFKEELTKQGKVLHELPICDRRKLGYKNVQEWFYCGGYDADENNLANLISKQMMKDLLEKLNQEEN